MDLNELSVPVEGMDIIGGEQDRSGVGSQEDHCDVVTVVGVTF